MRSKIASTMVGASPMDGSSSINSSGAEASPRPIASICCSPPESVPASWPRRSASTGNSSRIIGQQLAPALLSVARVGAHFEVLHHGHGGEHLAALGHVRDAELRALGRRHGEQVAAVVRDLATEGRDHARDGLEQGGFAGAVRPDHRDELPALDVERHLAQRAQAAIGDVKRPDLEHGPSISCRDRPRSPPDCAPPAPAGRWRSAGRGRAR